MKNFVNPGDWVSYKGPDYETGEVHEAPLVGVVVVWKSSADILIKWADGRESVEPFESPIFDAYRHLASGGDADCG
jgi:hypothetical protein